MESTTLTMRKLFWAWEDEKEEIWLREMAHNGWHLDQVDFITYTFRKGEPGDIVYRLDYKSTPDADLPEYIELFAAAGWEYAGRLKNWHYFRKPAGEGSSDEIFTDVDSRIKKYQTIIGLLTAIFPSLYLLFVVSDFGERMPPWFTIPFTLFFILIMGFYIFAMLNLINRITDLKKLK